MSAVPCILQLFLCRLVFIFIKRKMHLNRVECKKVKTQAWGLMVQATVDEF